MKFVVTLAALIVCAPALAQSCIPRDISAYREDMKRPLTRELVARTYCGMQARRADMMRGTRQADACDTELQKISDVMGQAKAYREHQFAMAGCQGDFKDFKLKRYNAKTEQFE